MFLDGQGNVDRSQQGEDVRLKGGDHQFEGHERNAGSQGQCAEADSHCATHVEVKRVSGREAQNQQQVANQHIRQKTDHERCGPDNERREQLDRRHDEVDRPRDTSWHELALEVVAYALGADTRDKEAEVGKQRIDQRHTDDRGRSDLEAGNDARDVHEEHAQEDRQEHGHVSVALLLPDDLVCHLGADEVHDRLDGGLESSRNKLGLPNVECKHNDECQHRNEAHHDDAVNREGCALKKEWLREEFFDRRCVPLAIACRRRVNGGLRRECNISVGEQCGPLCDTQLTPLQVSQADFGLSATENAA